MAQSKDIVKKAADVVHIAANVSTAARKIFNALLFQSYGDLLEKEFHTVRIKDLQKSLGAETRNRENLKRLLDELLLTKMEVIRFPNTKKEGVTGSVLIGSYDICKGNLEYSYPYHLRRLLYYPDFFIRFNLEFQKKLSKHRSLELYENLKRYEKIGKSAWRSVDMWRKVLCAEHLPHYQQFKRFRSQILVPAVRQVNKFTDITVKAEYQKVGRKVTRIRFIVRKNSQYPLFNDDTSDSEYDEDLEIPAGSVEDIISHLEQADYDRLVEQFKNDVLPESPSLKKAYDNKGLGSPSVKVAFLEFAEDLLDSD